MIKFLLVFLSLQISEKSVLAGIFLIFCLLEGSGLFLVSNINVKAGFVRILLNLHIIEPGFICTLLVVETFVLLDLKTFEANFMVLKKFFELNLLVDD